MCFFAQTLQCEMSAKPGCLRERASGEKEVKTDAVCYVVAISLWNMLLHHEMALCTVTEIKVLPAGWATEDSD